MDDVLAVVSSSLALLCGIYGTGYGLGWLIGSFRSFAEPDERD